MGKQDDFFRTQIRIPTGIHLALKEAAEESGRSMNAEIVARLEQSFSPGQGLIGQAMIESETKRMEEMFSEMRQDLLDEVKQLLKKQKE